MKILSLWQLYASLCIWTDSDGNAEKQFETRSWSTSYRGLIAIHATKSFPDFAKRECLVNPYFRDAMARHWIDFPEQLAFGEILGVVELVDIFSTNKVEPKSEKERAFGDWSMDRFAWKLRNPRELPNPIPFKGSQGLRGLPEETALLIRSQLDLSAEAQNKHLPLFEP